MLRIILSLITITLLLYNCYSLYIYIRDTNHNSDMLEKVYVQQEAIINEYASTVEELKGDLEFMTQWKNDLSKELERLK